MSKQIDFDSIPRGYTSQSGCSTWMEPRFRQQAMADHQQLQQQLTKMTRVQLASFIQDAGQIATGKKADLVTYAHVLQYRAWYPITDVTTGQHHHAACFAHSAARYRGRRS